MTEPKQEPKQQVQFTCNCGDEIIADVDVEQGNVVVCQKCGQEYRFTARDVYR